MSRLGNNDGPPNHLSANLRTMIQVFRHSAPEKLGVLFYDSPLPMAVIEPKTCTLIEVNPAFLLFSEYSREETTGLPVDEILFSEANRDFIEEVFRRNALPQSHEIVFRTKTGTPKTVILSGSSTCITGLDCLIIWLRDITKRKMPEKSVEEREAQYRRVLEVLPDCMMVHEMGIIRYVNDWGAKLLGYPSPADLIGRSLYDLVESTTAVRLREAFRGMERGEAPATSLEFECLRRDGTPFASEARGACLEYGGASCIELIMRDVTARRLTEEKVEECNRQLNFVLTNSLDAVYQRNLQTDSYDYMSPAIEKLVGFSVQDMCRLGIDEVKKHIHPDDLAMVNREIELTSKGEKEMAQIEYRFKDRSGEYRWLADHFSLLKDNRGQALYRVGIVRDITERKNMEDVLRSSEEKYRTLVEKANDGIIIVQDGILKYANPRMAELDGSTLDLLLTTPITDHIHATDVSRVAEMHQKRMAGQRVPASYEAMLQRRDGTPALCELTLGVITYQGRPATLAIIRDITDRKNMEEELRLSRNELELRVQERTEELRRQAELLDLAHDAIILRTLDHSILWWSRGAERMYGYSREEAVGENCLTLLKTEFPLPLDRIEDTMKRDGYWEGDLIRFTKDGRELIARSRWAVQHDEGGKPLAVMDMCLDMTEQRRMEEELRQAQKMEAIGTLAGGIAHDFNNILAIIMGNTELAIEDVNNGNLSDRTLQKILSATRRGRDLTRQILTFSRKARQERRTRIDVTPVLQESFKLLRSSVPSFIRMSLRLESKSPIVLGNPIQIQQIVMNLTTNAAHAMQKNGGELTIRLRDITIFPDRKVPDKALKAGDYLELTVSDTGTGMSDRIRSHIFEPFYTTKEPGHGTGMGLPVVYGIVKNYGGTITVESAPGRGSVFTVYLPKERSTSGEEELVETIPPGNGERILFVDDEEPLVEIAQEMLEKMGYRPTVMADSLQAWHAFAQNPHAFNLVITDQSMPDLMGTVLARKMLKMRPDIPIILCTGYSDVASLEKVRKIGIRDFIMKPLIRRELAAIIRRVLHPGETVTSFPQGGENSMS